MGKGAVSSQMMCQKISMWTYCTRLETNPKLPNYNIRTEDCLYHSHLLFCEKQPRVLISANNACILVL